MRFILPALLLLASPVWAADLYLDGSTSGCSNGSTTYDPATRACGNGSDKVYLDVYTASNNLGSGDHLYIRSGAYYYNASPLAWNSGSLNIDGAGTIVENYGTELVWLQSGDNHTDVDSGDLNNPVAIYGTGCILRGNGYNLKIWGCIIFGGTKNTVKGVDVSGGWDHQSPIGGDAWYDVVRFQSSVGALLQDCILHDNYNHGTTTNTFNMALIMHLYDRGTIVENCEIYNSHKNVASIKKSPSYAGTQATYRFNFYHSAVANGLFWVIDDTGPSPIPKQDIYQNVAVGTQGVSGFGGVSGDVDSIRVYNNTLYGVQAGPRNYSTSAPGRVDYYNNLHECSSETCYGVYYDEAALSSGYIDYNDYYANGGSMRWLISYTDYSTLASWQSASGYDTNSVATDPGFSADDSTVDGNSPTDFKRITYTTNGRGGSYPSVMGAYITGNETIGLLNGAAPAETCSDGIQNQDERGVDCDGVCPACAGGGPSSRLTPGGSGMMTQP